MGATVSHQCGGGVKSQEHPFPTGRAGHGFLHRAALPITPPLRRKPCRATRGERVGGQVSARAVGRRGPFPEGRSSFRLEKCCPSGKGPSGSDRHSSAFTTASKRSRRPRFVPRRPRLTPADQYARPLGNAQNRSRWNTRGNRIRWPGRRCGHRYSSSPLIRFLKAGSGGSASGSGREQRL